VAAFLFLSMMPSYQKNSYIENHISRLIAKKGKNEGLDEEQMRLLMDSLYTRFESMLGRNLVEFLPEKDREGVRKKLAGIALNKDGRSLESVSAILDRVNMDEIDFPGLLKITLQELSDEFLNS